MLTAPVINKSPRGLLSWLGLKSGGAQPQSLSTQLIPTVELGEWYFETNARYTISTPGVVASALGDAQFAGPTAPTDYNRVVEYAVRATVPAGTIMSIQAAYFTVFENGTTQGIPVGEIGRHSGRAAAEIVVSRADGPFFIPPGGAYGFIVTELSGAGTPTVFGYLAYCEIRN